MAAHELQCRFYTTRAGGAKDNPGHFSRMFYDVHRHVKVAVRAMGDLLAETIAETA